MPHIILFEDNPDADPELRRRYMAQHLAFLQKHADRIAAAGPLLETDGAGAGGLWLVTEDDPAEIDRLIREDPFWPTGLRLSHRILRWHRVFADDAQLLALKPD